MLRLGLALASNPLARGMTARVVLPAHTNVLSMNSGVFIQRRDMGKTKDSAVKKKKYGVEEAKKKKEAKPKVHPSASRFKRTSWLDSPRGVVKKKNKNHPHMGLNTDKAITRHVKDLSQPKMMKNKAEGWMTTLIKQVKVSPENALKLSNRVVRNRAHHPNEWREDTYHLLLDLWYRRKDEKRAKEVFNTMKRHKGLTDKAYSLYCKCLATRGDLDTAKKLLEECRASKTISSAETMMVMVNYVAANNITEGVKLFSEVMAKLKNAQWIAVQAQNFNEEQRAALEKNAEEQAVTNSESKSKGESGKEASVTTGEEGSQSEATNAEGKTQASEENKGEETSATETPKTGENTSQETAGRVRIVTKQEIADAEAVIKIIQPHVEQLYSTVIAWALKHGDAEAASDMYIHYCDFLLDTKEELTDKEFDERVRTYEAKLKERNAAIKEWEKQVVEYEKEHPVNKKRRKEDPPRPKKPREKLPPYPARYTDAEFLRQFPPKFTSHIFRPLIDMEAAGKELPEIWIERFVKGLHATQSWSPIRGLANKIYLGKNMERYEQMRSVLKKLGLPYEELTKVNVKVKGTAPQKKVGQVIKKWWKIGGKIPDEE